MTRIVPPNDTPDLSIPWTKTEAILVGGKGMFMTHIWY